jgi:hypothetical protein
LLPNTRIGYSFIATEKMSARRKRMKATTIIALPLILAMATSVRAVSLVVMATNATAIPGEKVFTIGVEVTAKDVALGGGPNTVLLVQNLTFNGSTNGPIHQTGAANVPDVQSLQTDFIDPSAIGGPPGPNLGTVGNSALYGDSWWYNGAGGTLQGVIDSAGDTGTVTTNPAGDGSGVYTIGAFPNSGTNAVGSTGYVFFPDGTPGAVPANPTTGQTMAYTGLFGPLGANYFDPSAGGPFTDPHYILGDLLVANGGTLTVPLAQIVASGNVRIPSDFAGGAGTFIDFGNGNVIYNVLGGPARVDPGAYLNYGTNTIVPEPSTLVLAALGAIALLAYRRRR